MLKVRVTRIRTEIVFDCHARELQSGFHLIIHITLLVLVESRTCFSKLTFLDLFIYLLDSVTQMIRKISNLKAKSRKKMNNFIILLFIFIIHFVIIHFHFHYSFSKIIRLRNQHFD